MIGNAAVADDDTSDTAGAMPPNVTVFPLVIAAAAADVAVAAAVDVAVVKAPESIRLIFIRGRCETR